MTNGVHLFGFTLYWSNRRADWETEQRVKAKLAARRAASERGFAAETREAVTAAVAEHDRSVHQIERGRRSFLPKATHTATVSEMPPSHTLAICRCSPAVCMPA